MQTSIICSICNNSQMLVTDPESGEIICRNCGMVMLDNLQDSRPEWRSFTTTTDEVNDSRSRTGMPTSLARHDMGLATMIGSEDKDASGRKIDGAMRFTMNRLRTWNFRTQADSSTNRNLIRAFNELDRLKDKLGLSDAVIEKMLIYIEKFRKKD